jgi:pilus assembly protein Flp/PilA
LLETSAQVERETADESVVVAKLPDPRRGFMLALWTKVNSWMRDDKGASMVEYALLVVLIAIVALVAVRLAGNEVSATFSEIGSGLA